MYEPLDIKVPFWVSIPIWSLSRGCDIFASFKHLIFVKCLWGGYLWQKFYLGNRKPMYHTKKRTKILGPLRGYLWSLKVCAQDEVTLAEVTFNWATILKFHSSKWPILPMECVWKRLNLRSMWFHEVTDWFFGLHERFLKIESINFRYYYWKGLMIYKALIHKFQLLKP